MGGGFLWVWVRFINGVFARFFFFLGQRVEESSGGRLLDPPCFAAVLRQGLRSLPEGGHFIPSPWLVPPSLSAPFD